MNYILYNSGLLPVKIKHFCDSFKLFGILHLIHKFQKFHSHKLSDKYTNVTYIYYKEVFLHFCNGGESRVLFVQLPPSDTEGLDDDDVPCVSLQPPKRITEKAIMFIKCLHASKLSREEISNELSNRH